MRDVRHRSRRRSRDPAALGKALYSAAIEGETAVAELLLDRDAPIGATPRPGGYTPLHIAAQNGHVAVANLLLSRGAALNRQTEDGYTPLDLAVILKKPAVARALEEQGARHGAAWREPPKAGSVP